MPGEHKHELSTARWMLLRRSDVDVGCWMLCCMMQNTNRLQIAFIELCSISITEMQTTNGINSQLSITHSDRQDSGVYKCVAENPFGKSEHVIYVAVQGMYANA